MARERLTCSECSVKNCFAHSLKLSRTTEIKNVDQVFKGWKADSISRDATEQGSSVRSVGLLNLPNLCDGKDAIENLLIEIQFQKVAVVLKKDRDGREIGKCWWRRGGSGKPSIATQENCCDKRQPRKALLVVWGILNAHFGPLPCTFAGKLEAAETKELILRFKERFWWRLFSLILWITPLDTYFSLSTIKQLSYQSFNIPHEWVKDCYY